MVSRIAVWRTWFCLFAFGVFVRVWLWLTGAEEEVEWWQLD